MGISKAKIKDNLGAYLLISPFMFVFSVFMVYPIFYALYLSFHVIEDLYTFETRFIGFNHFQHIFKDTEFLWSLLMTFYYAILTVPAGIMLSLLLAVLLRSKLKGATLFRTAYFLPYVLDTLVVAIIWIFLYYMINQGLQAININWFKGSGILGNPLTAMPAVALAMILKGLGFGMILFLAAINNIPDSVYESAEIDGAGPVSRFFNITLPLVRPIMIFMIIIGFITALNAFAEVYAMTEGGPSVTVGNTTLGATKISGYYLFRKFYVDYKFGYSAAVSYILLFITLIISWINMRIFRAGETD
jgi:multiple sugar transport system permease protein